MSLFGIFFTLTSFLKRHKHQLPQITNDPWRFLISIKTLIAAIWYLFLSYSFNELEMKRSASLEKVNGADAEAVSNARKPPRALHTCNCSNVSKRRLRSAVGNVLEQYSISIKPKLSRSSSLCDLTNTSEFNLDIIKISQHKNRRKQKFPFHDRSGDAVEKYVNELTENPYMSCGSRGKKSKKKDTMMSETYGSKFASDYINNLPSEALEINFSSVENSSTSSTNQTNGSAQKGAAFPFKSTPSGNLKVQSNQVVFQSSTVGVILADPTQAKVKVKFEGQAAGEPDDFISQNYDNDTENELRLQYGTRDVDDSKLEVDNSNYQVKNSNFHGRLKTKSPGVREDKGKDLSSLGYAVPEPIDWMRVQLPKKQDLFQEFFRRIHNYMHIVSITRRFTNSAPAAVDCIMAEFVSRNTDTVVRIGDEEFHCHRIVLQIYSSFFEMNPQREIELQTTNVTPEAFQSVYIWMIFSAQESIRSLKRENVLDLFCAAQYLAIKDLEEQCWSLIVNENLFTEDTAFALFREARQKGMTHVMDIMVPRVMRFFLPLVASTNFLTLEPEEILIFLKSNFISVTSEIEVLMSGVRWLYGDWSSRRRYAVEVMRCIRFGLISPWQLVDIKRNPDNNEVLEIVNDPEVQQMVDDGLAFVIIKYWYGNNSKNYYHWIDVLGLTEPAERNWIGEEKNHVTYKDFLKYLEQFMVPREQMYQQMAMMQTARRSDDIPGSMRGIDSEKMEMRRPKMDFPLPATLKGLTVDKDKSFPTMSEFFENQKRNQECKPFPPPCRSPPVEMDRSNVSPPVRRRSPCGQHQKQFEEHKCQQELKQNTQQCKIHQIHMCSVEPQSVQSKQDMFEPPEKDSEETTTLSETSSCTVDEKNLIGNFFQSKSSEKRHSVAASYLAAATAALAGTRRTPSPTNGIRSQNAAAPPPRAENAPTGVAEQPQTSNIFSPQISMFNNSKESLARVNKNKLSYSILGPSNKNYILDGSLFNWDRETVLVFGGIDPHTSYGVGSNTGKDIFRFEPVTNLWENVGELPEPRHHHSVAFLRGRVYLVGGADPRDDDIRGKSVVVSTVWSYEPVSRSWYSESGLAVPRKNFGLVVHRMALYAIGGQDKRGRVLRSVEKFDPKTAAWTEVRSMGVARMAVAVTKYREYIWVAGGMTGEKKKPVCKIVECYNSNTNHASGMFAEMRVDCFYSTMRKRGTSLVRRVPTSSNTIINVFANRWTEIHSLRFPRCFATLFAMNDKLFIIGGAGKVSDKDKTASSVGAIDVWDWQSRQWKHETDMSMPRHGHALAYLGTQLIIIGGVTTIYMRALNNVESFCCERGAWIRGVATLPTPLSGHGAVTLPPASLM